MYLKKSTNRKTGRTYLSIVNSYYDKETKQSRTATVRSLGYLDELLKQYDDPIAFFTEEVRKMNEEMNKENSTINLKISLNETMPLNYSARKNFGYAALSKIYHELQIDKFIKNKQRYSKEEYEEIKLKDRTWKCPKCGAVHDRDENAAKNLRKYGIAYISSQ